MDTTSRAFEKVRFLKMDSPGRGSGHHIQGSKKVLGKKVVGIGFAW